MLAKKEAESSKDPRFEFKTVLVELIDPPICARPIDSEHVQRLAESIDQYGLFQRPGVIAEGDRYRTVYGNTRIHAHKRLGRTSCDVAVLPSGTTPADEMSYSIQENELRQDEHFLDLLVRIDQQAKFAGCSPTQAAEANGVSGSRLSRIRKLDGILDEAMKSSARKHDVGMSVLYEIAQAATPSERKAFLDAYIAGDLKRDQIVEAIARKKGRKPRKAKTISLDLEFDGVPVAFSLPQECSYDEAFHLLKSAARRLQQFQKQDVALECLPEIFAKQRSAS